MTDHPGDFSFPFEPVGGDPIMRDMADTIMAGGLTCLAGGIDAPDLPGDPERGIPDRPAQCYPVVLFQFHDHVGNLMPPISLVLDADKMHDMKKIINHAIDMAITESEKR